MLAFGKELVVKSEGMRAIAAAIRASRFLGETYLDPKRASGA